MAPQAAKITVNLEGIDDMINSLAAVGTPSFRITNGFERVLREAFLQTQEAVHVISGRLKASGHTESNHTGAEWSGSIVYGGPSGTPAYYGIYEMNRGGTRPDGTPHDFFAGLSRWDDQFQAVIDEHFKVLE